MNELLKAGMKVALSVLCIFTFSVCAKPPPSSSAVTGCGIIWDRYCARITQDQFGPGNWSYSETKKRKYYEGCVTNPPPSNSSSGSLSSCARVTWPGKDDPSHVTPYCSKWITI
ncbi:hypothetical protein [Aliikangiella sp. IMCC44359]|uniref:hypothetical protein n=1 Tax=Aliikangiella sp. IMCC44359 TaxID=3459125 RepID=UPI00403AC7B9